MSGQICPECLARHPAGTGRCPSDRAGLLDLGEGPEPLGTVFADRFLILDRIGKGGMAVVYRAWQRNVRRLVAVKVLPADDPGDRKRIQRFVREGWLTAPLQCPHTVRVHDSGCLPDGTLFLAMELLTGRTLEQILKDEGRLEARRACGLVCQVCLALEEAHGKGIVHRDLKPTNLMVERLGDQGDFARVLDFGIAAVLDERVTRLTRSGEVFGTPYYMSPEQFESRPVGPWTDLYALGIVLYECIVGDPPLVADSQLALMVKHCKTPPPHLGEDLGLGPLREPLDRIVQRCLAKKPEDRPPSAAALRRDLEALLRQEPAHSGPEPQPVSVQRSRRPVGRLAAIAVPAVCLLGLAAGLVVSSDRLFDTPAEVAEDTGTEAMGVVAPWPDRIRFLVMPLSAFPEREADRSLWPLVDRMIVNALEPDELLLDRLERVDPARVESEIRRREMAVPPGDDDIRELAKTMNANVVLQGRIFRAGGEVRIEGTIRTLAAREGLPVQAAGTNVVEAAENLVPAIRSVLWGQAPAPIPGSRLRRLFLNKDKVSDALLGLRASMPAAERRSLFERVLRDDPGAVGVAWLRFLDNVEDADSARDLRTRAAGIEDPQVRAFFAEIGDPRIRPEACAGLDTTSIGQRFPETLGPLAEAACLFRRGRIPEAVDKALEANDILSLRSLARPFVLRLVQYGRPCESIIDIRMRIQRVWPEYVVGWSVLADWNAKCDRMTEAKSLLKTAYVLMGEDIRTQYLVGYHGALVHLVDLDIAGARPWMEILERSRGTRTDYPILKSLYLLLQGRFRDGLDVVRQGLEAAAKSPSDVYTMLAVAHVYLSLYLGDVQGATRVCDEFDRLFPDPNDAGNRYGIAMLRLAVEYSRKPPRARSDLAARIAVLGDEVERRLGDAGRIERESQEAFLLSHLGSAESCKDLLFRASGDRVFLGGCRFRYARTLADAGKATEAAEQYRLAIKEMVWARFAYAEFVPTALLERAKALLASGDSATAREVFRKVVSNFAGADRELSEVIAAREALAGLAK